MNIYELFRHASGNSTVTRKKLIEIWETYCPEVPLNLLELHRKIHHQKLYLAYWKPVNKYAPLAVEKGNYIDEAGNIFNTETRTRTTKNWQQMSVYYLSKGTNALSRKYQKDQGFKAVIEKIGDRSFHLVYINQHTIPKWDPKSQTICLDVRTDLHNQIEKLLQQKYIVLRCIPLSEENQYDLWLFHRSTHKLKHHIATVIGESIGLGKTSKGSKKSGHIKNAKKITEALL